MTTHAEAPAGTGASDEHDDYWGVEDNGIEPEGDGGGWWPRPSTKHTLFLRGLRATSGGLVEARAYTADTRQLLRVEALRRSRTVVARDLVEAGADLAAADFLIGAAIRSGDRHDLRPLSFREVLALRPPPEVIEGWVAAGEVAMIFGTPGSYKTFLALDMGAAVAGGQDWHGRATKPSPVLYAVGEGLGDFGKRLGALQALRGEEIAARFHFASNVPNLLSGEDVGRFLEIALPIQPGLVVIDTLAMAMPGGDENSAKDMGSAMQHLRHMAHVSGAAVLIVHHSTKTSTGTERGSGALLGAVDVSMNLIEMRSGTSSVLALEQVKSRNRPLTDQLFLDIRQVEGSVVVEAADDGWSTATSYAGPRHTRDATNIKNALMVAGQPMNQGQLQEAVGISPKRWVAIRSFLKEHSEVGVKVERQGNAYLYSLADPDLPLPPKGGEEEGKNQ